MTFLMAGAVRALPLSIFGAVVAVTLGITYWASKRTRTAADFWAAGRAISPLQNGLAIVGDFVSAAAFLGVTGLIFLGGFDGWLTLIGALVSFVPVLLILADRMRNAGKFTMVDVLAFRLNARPARTAAAIGTLGVLAFYLLAQMVAAGTLIEGLTGVDFSFAVVITGGAMLIYVVFGGMLATTWVQIIKAVLVFITGGVLAIWVLSKFGFNPVNLLDKAAGQSKAGRAFLGPGLIFKKPLDEVSAGLAFALGTAGLPHILMRFFTVRDAKAARASVGWVVLLLGIFYVFIATIGLGARALLGSAGEAAAGKGGNLAAPLLAEKLGGGAGSAGGEIFFAIVAAVSFATILAVVAGLVISASSAIAHDIWTNVLHPSSSERSEVKVGRVAAGVIGVIAIALALLAGKGFNIQILVGLAFAVAASANFPALLLSLLWRRFNTAGALTGVAFGLISSVTLIILSPAVWPGPGGPFPLANPAVVSIPIGFLGCFLGTLLSREGAAEHTYGELRVRAETGIGSEVAERAIVKESRPA